MFASGTGSMRGPRAKTPLLLLLLLLSTLTGTVSCQDEDAEPETEDEEALDTGTESQPDPEEPSDGEDPGIPTTVSDGASASSPSPTGENLENRSEVEEDHGSGLGRYFSGDALPIESTLGPDFTGTAPPDEPGEEEEEEEDGLSFIIILIPVVLVVLIIGMIVCGIFINRRWNQKVRNQELRKEDPYLDGSSTEKVPMPMFEEDVPSVLELEMEELGQWMKKDGEPADDSKLA